MRRTGWVGAEKRRRLWEALVAARSGAAPYLPPPLHPPWSSGDGTRGPRRLPAGAVGGARRAGAAGVSGWALCAVRPTLRGKNAPLPCSSTQMRPRRKSFGNELTATEACTPDRGCFPHLLEWPEGLQRRRRRAHFHCVRGFPWLCQCIYPRFGSIATSFHLRVSVWRESTQQCGHSWVETALNWGSLWLSIKSECLTNNMEF